MVGVDFFQLALHGWTGFLATCFAWLGWISFFNLLCMVVEVDFFQLALHGWGGFPSAYSAWWISLLCMVVLVDVVEAMARSPLTPRRACRPLLTASLSDPQPPAAPAAAERESWEVAPSAELGAPWIH